MVELVACWTFRSYGGCIAPQQTENNAEKQVKNNSNRSTHTRTHIVATDWQAALQADREITLKYANTKPWKQLALKKQRINPPNRTVSSLQYYVITWQTPLILHLGLFNIYFVLLPLQLLYPLHDWYNTNTVNTWDSCGLLKCSLWKISK